TSSGSSLDALFDSSSGHSSLDNPSSALPSGMRFSHQLCSSVPSTPYSSAVIIERPSHSSFVGPFRKRSRSPAISVPASSPIHGALRSIHADLLPPVDLEVSVGENSESFVPRGMGLGVDINVKGSDELYSEPDIDPDVQADINKCITYADALRPGGIDARPKIPQWKWENITMDFITKLPEMETGQDTIWVIVDRLTKSAYFLPMREDDSLEKLTR
nr:putative reverse transcriptase domain-containing protein [Tanacetum cinerariifolium]